VDLEQFGRRPAADERGDIPTAERPLEIIAVGRCIGVKGHIFLVDAAALLGTALPFRITVYGDGVLRPELERRVARLGLTERVRFAGFVDHDRIHEAYAAADLFVMPSLAEGLPVALVEALGAGLPVIASDIAEHRQVAPDGVLSLVAVGDPAAIATAISELAADPARRAEMRRRGREIAESTYTWERVTDAFEALLATTAAATQ
jgi:glycosyltransferase involved in cell wall biosynthesis